MKDAQGNQLQPAITIPAAATNITIGSDGTVSELDRVSHTVQRRGRVIDLSPKEFSLLEFLMRHAGQPAARAAIVEQAWKLHFDTITNVVTIYINYLRRKTDSGCDRPLIRTVRGIGYQIGAHASHN